MDLLIELAVKAVKAYLEKEGIAPALPVAPKALRYALFLTEDHCGSTCAKEKHNSEICDVTCALMENYEVDIDCYDTVVLYNMTNVNLFKLANGCTDSKFLTLAAEAILKGKRVLMVEEDVEILKFKDTTAKALYNNIHKNLQIILDSGVTLVVEDKLQAALEEGCPAPKQGQPVQTATTEAPAPESVYEISKKVVTERDIREAAAKHMSVIRLTSKPVITQLARDTAFELGIELI